MVEQLLNTLDERTFLRHGAPHTTADDLTSVATLQGWLADHDLPAGEPTERDLAATRAFRSALRAALLADEPAADALAQFPVRIAPARRDLRLVADTGNDGLDALVEAVATSVGDGRWRRLKLCASEDCHWAFYDASRSGGGRWCSMETCGNRHKTRAYRQRQAG